MQRVWPHDPDAWSASLLVVPCYIIHETRHLTDILVVTNGAGATRRHDGRRGWGVIFAHSTERTLLTFCARTCTSILTLPITRHTHHTVICTTIAAPFRSDTLIFEVHHMSCNTRILSQDVTVSQIQFRYAVSKALPACSAGGGGEREGQHWCNLFFAISCTIWLKY